MSSIPEVDSFSALSPNSVAGEGGGKISQKPLIIINEATCFGCEFPARFCHVRRLSVQKRAPKLVFAVEKKHKSFANCH